MRFLHRYLPLLALLAVAFTPGPEPAAHTGEKLDPLRLTIARWALAYQGDDYATMGELLAADFGDSPAARNHYLARMRALPVKQVLLRYANYRIDGRQATVSDVVYVPYRELNNPFALEIALVQEGEDWKIRSIEEALELPEELSLPDHPLLHSTHDQPVRLRDADDNSPLYARVHIRDSEGNYWAPQGHRKTIALGWREDIGGDVVVDGKTWAYVGAEFIVSVPEGRYTIEVTRGPEYIPEKAEFTVTGGEQPTLDLTLKRWSHMARRGWFSGDSHTHFLDPQTAMLEARGEDLNVINVLASSGGNLITSVNHFTGAPSVFSDEHNIVYIAEETRHDYLGHTVLLNLKELIYPFGWGGPHTGVHGGYDYPTMAQQADRAHEQGALVAWSHFPHPHGELPIDVALGKIDAVEAMVFGSPFNEHPVRTHSGEFSPAPLRPIELWYALLNTGFDLPALGSTDKMWNTQVAGSVRTYVRVDSQFDYQAWIDGIRAGRTFLTTGPMLFLTLAGRGLGDTVVAAGPGNHPFVARVESRLPVSRIEIVVNGKVAAALENPEGREVVEFSGELAIPESAWVAARAYSDAILPTQFHLTGSGSPLLAHTSPIYVETGGKPRRSAASAAYLAQICEKTIGWAGSAARYHDEAQRREVIDLYREGCSVFTRQAEGDTARQIDSSR